MLSKRCHRHDRRSPTYKRRQRPFTYAFDRLSIGFARHKLAWKRVRRCRTAVFLLKHSTHGSELALVCTNGSNVRIDVKISLELASFEPTLEPIVNWRYPSQARVDLRTAIPYRGLARKEEHTR